MTFDVSAEAYGRFMGRFSVPLTAEFIELVQPRAGQRALDVGCGPGALTATLVDLLGEDAVGAVDPSEPFIAAARERFPGVDVRVATAEDLPYADDSFDLTLAQLVVHFMSDPVAGIQEMGRVTRPGGLVAANAWDIGGGRAPFSVMWQAVSEVDASAEGDTARAGSYAGHLVEIFEAAGLADVQESVLTVSVPFADVDEWWEPFTLGVGPAGVYVAALDAQQRAELRDRCAALLPSGPFEMSVSAWAVTGRV